MSILSIGIERGKEIGKKEGISAGRAESILDCLAELGSVPDVLAQQIRSQKNPETLKKWLKAAIQADSVEAFAKSIEN